MDDESTARTQERQTWADIKEAEYRARKEIRKEATKLERLARLERQREDKEEREMIERMLDALCSMSSSASVRIASNTSYRAASKSSHESGRTIVRIFDVGYSI